MISALKFFKASSLRLPVCLLIFIAPTFSFAQFQRARLAVLDFGASATGVIVGDVLRSRFTLDAGSPSNEFEMMDRELTKSAARGTGYAGSLNMSRQEARDLGAA